MLSSFLRDLASGLVPIFVLDYAWYLGSSLMLLGSCLWCWSWDHHVAFVQVTSCTLLNYKTITCKFISPIWLCWLSNTKIQSKWAYGPFSLQSPPFCDWWQHDQNKQIIKILEFKNYLLARMQCKRQGYIILKDTTCWHLCKLILSLQMSPYGIMDLSLYHMLTYLKTYLALVNVSMWHYGFKLSPNSIIYYPSFLGPLLLINYYDRAYFGSYKFSLFGIKYQKEDISSTREGQTLWSFVCGVE